MNNEDQDEDLFYDYYVYYHNISRQIFFIDQKEQIKLRMFETGLTRKEVMESRKVA